MRHARVPLADIGKRNHKPLRLGIIINITVLGLGATLLFISDSLREQGWFNTRGAPTEAVTADASILPLGVYMAGEWLPGRNGSIRNQIDWAAIDHRLDVLQAQHVNAVWLTHVNGAEAGEFARRAAVRGIRIIAALNDFNCHWESCKNRTADEHRAVISRELAAYGPAPPPLAWGLGDEPDPDAGWDRWVFVWKTYYRYEPITAVFRSDQYPGVCSLGGPCPLDFLAMDHYTFFSEKNPYALYTVGNPYEKGSIPAEAWEWTHHAAAIVGRGAVPWAMGQAFQEVWGPYAEDSNGEIIIQPGGALHWSMPSQAQVKWQAWTGLAVGAKGIWFFLHSKTSDEPFYRSDLAKHLPSVTDRPVNTGAPHGLTYKDGRPTPQLESLASVFGKVRAVGAVFQSAVPARRPAASIVANTADDPTAFISALCDNNTTRCWVVVVAGYQGIGDQRITVEVGAPVTGLVNILTGDARLPLAGAFGALHGEVTLLPGDAAVFECEYSARQPPLLQQ